MGWHHHSLQGQAIFGFQLSTDPTQWISSEVDLKWSPQKKIPFIWGLAKNFFTGCTVKWASSKNWSKISKRKQNSKRVVRVFNQTFITFSVDDEIKPPSYAQCLWKLYQVSAPQPFPWAMVLILNPCTPDGRSAGLLSPSASGGLGETHARSTCQEQGPAFLT